MGRPVRPPSPIQHTGWDERFGAVGLAATAKGCPGTWDVGGEGARALERSNGAEDMPRRSRPDGAAAGWFAQTRAFLSAAGSAGRNSAGHRTPAVGPGQQPGRVDCVDRCDRAERR